MLCGRAADCAENGKGLDPFPYVLEPYFFDCGLASEKRNSLDILWENSYDKEGESGFNICFIFVRYL